eukprot:616670_1
MVAKMVSLRYALFDDIGVCLFDEHCRIIEHSSHTNVVVWQVVVAVSIWSTLIALQNIKQALSSKYHEIHDQFITFIPEFEKLYLNEFQELTRSEFEKLMQNASVQKTSKHGIIRCVETRADVTELGYLIKGTLCESLNTTNANQFIGGDCIAMVNSSCHHYTVKAVTDCVYVAWSTESLNKLMKRCPKLGQAMHNALTKCITFNYVKRNEYQRKQMDIKIDDNGKGLDENQPMTPQTPEMTLSLSFDIPNMLDIAESVV